MVFNPGFQIGAIVSSKEIENAFKVSMRRGMSRSLKTNTLILICNHVKSLYDDKWYGNTLHYTGEGRRGDQSIDKGQNKTLKDSNSNGVEVHLFEVFKKREYIYQGIVKLAGEPYQDEQKDEVGNLRKVWIFPVMPIVGAEISKSTLDKYQQTRSDRVAAEKLTDDKLKKLAQSQSSSRKVSHRKVKSVEYIRNPYIAEYVKRCANGVCQLCGKLAPFNNKDGKPYLESHHIVWLSHGGEDSIANTVALCPNCHRKMHVVGDLDDIKKLQKIAIKNANS